MGAESEFGNVHDDWLILVPAILLAIGGLLMYYLTDYDPNNIFGDFLYITICIIIAIAGLKIIYDGFKLSISLL